MSNIYHSIYAEDQSAMEAFRREVACHPRIKFVPAMRPVFDALMAQTPAAMEMTYTAGQLGNVSGVWCRPLKTTPGAAVLYLHGGAHVLGSADAYKKFVGHLAGRAGLETFVPDYRRAPEHPFPADLEDARTAYEGLLDAGFHNIVVAGDSAGGGLALALVAELISVPLSGHAMRPVAVVVMSPWTDLSLSSESLDRRATHDPLLTGDILAGAVDQYMGGHLALDARASPVFAVPANLPPTLIHVGEDEVLLDDSLRYASAAEAAGSHVTTHIWEGMTHVFPSSVAFLRAAGEALDDIGLFVRSAVAAAGS